MHEDMFLYPFLFHLVTRQLEYMLLFTIIPPQKAAQD